MAVPDATARLYKQTIKQCGPAGIKFVTHENAAQLGVPANPTVEKEFAITTDAEGKFIPSSVKSDTMDEREIENIKNHFAKPPT